MSLAAIIPAAGKPKIGLFPNTFDPMLPINGIPAIKYIIDSLKKRGVKKFILVLSKDDQKTQDFISHLRKKSSFEFIIVKTDASVGGVGNSVVKGVDKLDDSDRVIVNLGDTIIQASKKKISAKNYVLVSNRKVLDPLRWAFIEKSKSFNGNKIKIYDKPKVYKSGKIICGYYMFSDVPLLKKIAKRLSSKKLSMTEILLAYDSKQSLQLVEEKNTWYDLGNLDNYYQTKMDFLRVRKFNSLEYDKFRGRILKKSKKSEKIFWEVNWYQNVPNELKLFSPRLIDFELSKKESRYSLEFYGYPSLADLFLYGDLHEEMWSTILRRLVKYCSYVKDKHHQELPLKHYYSIYVTKTQQRVHELLKNKEFKKIWAYDTIIINGKKYKNISSFYSQEFLEKNLDVYNKSKDSCVIHGDMCFSNILFEVNSGLFKLIDPRGRFGDVGVHGDIKYDLAKIKHSIDGKYDNIIADLYELDYHEDVFNYNFFNKIDLNKNFDDIIRKEGFDPKQILYIEGLLYLTMIPLHSNSLDRQILMYLKAVEIFNRYLGVKV